MEKENKKILLVEDDQNFGAILKDYLILNDFDVFAQAEIIRGQIFYAHLSTYRILYLVYLVQSF